MSFVWDITCYESVEPFQVADVLGEHCKHWVFQGEACPTSGKHHYQCRFSLNQRANTETEVARRLGVSWHVSRTSTPGSKTFSYVMKDRTRVSGPWSDKNPPEFVPYQVAVVKDLWPFQQYIFDSRLLRDSRNVNVVFCPHGNKGKSTFINWCVFNGHAIKIPPCNDGERLLAAAQNICAGKKIRDPKLVFVDLPRAMDQNKLHGVYTALEQIKDGHLIDQRYHYKEWWIHSPQVWVFCNTLPPEFYVSKDRWATWLIDDQSKELVPA